jgi:hypothetical protein
MLRGWRSRGIAIQYDRQREPAGVWQLCQGIKFAPGQGQRGKVVKHGRELPQTVWSQSGATLSLFRQFVPGTSRPKLLVDNAMQLAVELSGVGPGVKHG